MIITATDSRNVALVGDNLQMKILVAVLRNVASDEVFLQVVKDACIDVNNDGFTVGSMDVVSSVYNTISVIGTHTDRCISASKAQQQAAAQCAHGEPEADGGDDPEESKKGVTIH